MKISAKSAGVAVALILLAVLVYVIIPKSKPVESAEDKNVNTESL
jgi:Na+-transporting methylmalonyl-CoA/oxaloacetate decarboxylase gamma subunit